MGLSITVVITNYNYGSYLGQAVRSVLTQTRRPDRIVVIDDGSTDGSSTVLDTLPASVEVVRQENRGVVATRNRGLDMTSTSHLVFLDADNWLLPCFLRWHERAWQLPHLPSLALTYSPARVIGPDGRVGYMHSAPWDAPRLFKRNYIDNNALFRTKALEDVGGYSKEFADLAHEDWDLMLKLADRQWHGRMVPRPTFVYRSSVTGRNASGGPKSEAIREAIRRGHPVTPAASPLTRLSRKLSNPVQTAFRRWDEKQNKGFHDEVAANRAPLRGAASR